MAGKKQFCVKWNNFESNMQACFNHLKDDKSLADVTLTTEGQSLEAHKMILSICSPYLKAILMENKTKHPIIILVDVKFEHLKWIIEYMYSGEVQVPEESLPDFLKTAARLEVKGLKELT